MSQNRYIYADDNPLRYVDPTGHRFELSYVGGGYASVPPPASNQPPATHGAAPPPTPPLPSSGQTTTSTSTTSSSSSSITTTQTSTQTVTVTSSSGGSSTPSSSESGSVTNLLSWPVRILNQNSLMTLLGVQYNRCAFVGASGQIEGDAVGGAVGVLASIGYGLVTNGDFNSEVFQNAAEWAAHGYDYIYDKTVDQSACG